MEAKTEAIDVETALPLPSEISTSSQDNLDDLTLSSHDGDIGDMKSLDGKPLPANKSSIFRSGGIIPTTICLSKTAIGAGLLSMPVSCAEIGAFYHVTLLLLVSLLAFAGIHMISMASVETQRWSFEDVCEELFYPAASFFTGLVNCCICLGSAAGFLIVCGQVFVVIFDADGRTRDIFVVLVGIFVCCPLALARHAGVMRHLAALSMGALLLLVITVGWFLSENGVDQSVSMENFVFGPGDASIFTYMNAINNLVFAYNNQMLVPQLTGELTPVPSTKGMTTASFLSTVLNFLLYGFVSVLGALAFGVAEGKDLILDLRPARKQLHVLISLLAVMLSVLTAFQFCIFPVRQFLAYNVRKLRGRGAVGVEDKADKTCYGRSMTRWYDIIGALGSVALVILIAVVITSLRAMLDFIGAFGAAYIGYVIPPLWIIALRRKTASKFSWFSAEMLFCLAFLALGLFMFVFGTYAAILPLVKGA